MTQMDIAPVGVFDTGVGGLTILKELLRELPDEHFIYFGDTGNCPYGVRPVAEIQELSRNAARFLLDHGVKIIVVACNTASVSALAYLRETFDCPFVGVVPAVKPAAALTRTGRIGVAATEASARGDYLRKLIAEHANGVEVHAVGCPRLVILAEAGILDGPEAEEAIRGYVGPMLDVGIDTLVLGCTHFPAMREAFERVVGPEVTVIDSGAAIARQTRRVLSERGWLAHPGSVASEPRALTGADAVWCSGDPDAFARVASVVLGMPVDVHGAPEMVKPLLRA
ncbi:MAG TPA: glutamate racemase [Ktedonobacterales bacterium]|nr:glutamate racemase [Ktedonobacterales bacterium]